MEQPKIKWSIGTKLVLTLVVLLFLTISLLSFSNILLFTGDKRAFTYQSQATQSLLMGRSLSGTIRTSLDTLRLMSSGVDPSKPVTPEQRVSLQSQIENQSVLFWVGLMVLDAKTGESLDLAVVGKDEWIKASSITVPKPIIDAKLLKDKLEIIKKNGVWIFKPQTSAPLLGVLFADLKYKPTEGKIPVSVGLFSLAELERDTKETGATVASMQGDILFSSESGTKDLASDPLFVTARDATIANGTREFMLSDDRYLGAYAKPGFDLIVLTRTAWKNVMSATYSIIEKFVLLGLAATFAGMVFIGLFSKFIISKPVQTLYEATRQVSEGNFKLALAPGGSDELGALVSSFNIMSNKIQDLIQDSVKRVQLENELKIASTVQQTLIPAEAYVDQKIEIHSRYASATECGGDWWGMVRQNNQICIMIADATGHGLPSALITAAAHSCFSVINKLAAEIPGFDLTPATLLSFANRAIFDSSNAKIMMTFFIANIDYEKGTLTYASAGHNPGWLFSKVGHEFELKSLMSKGPRLGEERDSAPFEEHTVPIKKGDMLFLYTDGLMDATNREGDKYGKKKTRQLLEAELKERPHSPGEVCSSLMSDLRRFNGPKPFDDDVTLVLAQLR